MQARDKIIKARAGLILDMPFFGNLGLRLELVEDKNCPTGYTNGKILAYNPTWINDMVLEKVKGFICHEIMHNALAHTTRRQHREQRKWNIACDYAINPILTESNIVLPDDGLNDPQYKDMSAEEIYSRLPDSDSNGSKENDPGGCGEVRDATGEDGQSLSSSEMAQLEQEWKIAVSQAAQQAKVMGSISGALARLIDDILEPKVDWKEVLRRFVDQSARNDYRWFPPNKRYISQGLYLPSLKSEELKPIVVAVDTSGSISKDELNQFASEITGILQDYKTSCTVIYCDAGIQNIEEFTTDNLPLTFNPKGGGGTDFRPVFEHIEKEGMQPSCLIYLTDMEGEFPQNAPNYPVLWAKIGKSNITSPFGEEVVIQSTTVS